jgi:hypothetical protein
MCFETCALIENSGRADARYTLRLRSSHKLLFFRKDGEKMEPWSNPIFDIRPQKF